jgi:anthranilate/para-aminobenzoate synthase component II
MDGMILIIDNTKTQKVKMYLPKLMKYFNEKNIQYTMIDGDITGLPLLEKCISDKNNPIKGIVLSGSPIMPYEHLKVEDYIVNLYCLKYLTHLPIIGICFGCQLMNIYFGGSLYDMKDVFCKKTKIQHTNTGQGIWKLLDGMAQFCCRYLPDYVSNKFNTMMTVQMESKTYSCVIKHKWKNLLGVMFHPEAMKKTHSVLDYFVSLTNK